MVPKVIALIWPVVRALPLIVNGNVKCAVTSFCSQKVVWHTQRLKRTEPYERKVVVVANVFVITF